MELAFLFQVFNVCDEGGKKYLSKHDIKVAVMMLFGHKVSKVFPLHRGMHMYV